MPATRPIDLRSDTVTQPTPAMRDAMARADVGDDVYGEDPTINLLEAQAASRLGKAAALFVPSGSMANLVAVMTHCVAGEEVLLGDQAHIGRIEASSMARVAGVLLTLLPNDPRAASIPARCAPRCAPRTCTSRAPACWRWRTPIISAAGPCFPGAHRCPGGRRPRERAAHASGRRAHLQRGNRHRRAGRGSGGEHGYRLFLFVQGPFGAGGLAVVRLGGVHARARRVRKMLGGAMRQAGVLAAAGLVALDTMVDRLRDDHANAQRLATGLEQQGLDVYAAAVETNIVMLAVPDAPSWARRLAAEGVLITVLGPRRARMVTHADVTASQIDIALERIATVRPVPA